MGFDWLGNRPMHCGHRDKFTSLTFVIPEETEDWAFVVKENSLPADCTSYRICGDCADLLPSHLAKKEEQARMARLRREAEDEELREQIEQARSGEQLFHCGGCDTNFPESELVQVRHCPHCEENFNGTDNGRNCENCNRPFSSKITDQGCPDCLADEECEAVDLDTMIREALKAYAFEIDSLPVTGPEMAKDEGLTSEELIRLYDLEVDASCDVGGGAAPLVKVYRRAKEAQS